MSNAETVNSKTYLGKIVQAIEIVSYPEVYVALYISRELNIRLLWHTLQIWHNICRICVLEILDNSFGFCTPSNLKVVAKIGDDCCWLSMLVIISLWNTVVNFYTCLITDRFGDCSFHKNRVTLLGCNTRTRGFKIPVQFNYTNDKYWVNDIADALVAVKVPYENTSYNKALYIKGNWV